MLSFFKQKWSIYCCYAVFLSAKLFADDTTIFATTKKPEDSLDDLVTLLLGLNLSLTGVRVIEWTLIGQKRFS